MHLGIFVLYVSISLDRVFAIPLIKKLLKNTFTCLNSSKIDVLKEDISKIEDVRVELSEILL